MGDREEKEEVENSEEFHVVSEINTFLVNAEIEPLLNSKNKVAMFTFYLPIEGDESMLDISFSTASSSQDSDGDLILNRSRDFQPGEEKFILIEYENSTTLDKVGLQVWRGAIFMSDFIIDQRKEFFEGKCVLELGAGTGFSGIISSLFAHKVIATDLNEEGILKLVEANGKHNKGLIQNKTFIVHPLDFTNSSWSKELKGFISEADTFIAADVVYHDRITTAFVSTLKEIFSTTTVDKPKNVFISMEKRYVFTVTDLDTVAPMYAHFLDQMESILGLSPNDSQDMSRKLPGNSNVDLKFRFVPPKFEQYFNYDRTKELILLHISSEFIS